MKKYNRISLPVLISAAAIITATSIWGTANIYAQDSVRSDPQDTIVQKLVQKFNLKESEVKAVFDEVHTERHEVMEKRLEERLAQAVLDGKINETQKQLILDKHKELEEKRDTTKDSFRTRQEMRTWAKDNGIDLQFMYGMGKRGFHRGMPQ